MQPVEIPLNEFDESSELEVNEDIGIEYGENMRIAGTNFLFEETFEGNKPLSTVINEQTSTNYGVTIANSPVFQGSKSGRFELRDSDPQAHGGTRAELFVINPIEQKDMWYSFAAYFPSKDYQYDNTNEVLSQWKQPGSSGNAFTLRIQRDEFYVRIIPTDKSREWKNLKLGKVDKDKWHEFVIHVVHSGKSDGHLEIWKNGEKVLDYKGPNNYDEFRLPYWKLGVYKPIWNKYTTSTSKRVVYYDNIRAGDKNASYNEMRSGTNNQTNSTPSILEDQVTSNEFSISLVNAHTEKVVKTISNNETIRFSTLGTNKLNFKANVGSNSSIQSVKFKLEGSNSHSYLDSAPPYALFGDDGKGNYYFGKILPQGTYKLTATFYSDKDGNKQAGSPLVTNFYIKN
jgi:hypothetical protein